MARTTIRIAPEGPTPPGTIAFGCACLGRSCSANIVPWCDPCSRRRPACPYVLSFLSDTLQRPAAARLAVNAEALQDACICALPWQNSTAMCSRGCSTFQLLVLPHRQVIHICTLQMCHSPCINQDMQYLPRSLQGFGCSSSQSCVLVHIAARLRHNHS